jgi:hypothetical protein
MGTNNPYLPDNVRSDEEAIQYLAMMVNALKLASYTTKTGAGPITLTAAEMVGGVIEFSGSTTAVVVNTATAAAIIAQMLALDVNAGVGSTALMTLLNDNTSSGTLTLTAGTGVTIVGTALVAIAASRRYQIKQLTSTTVSITNVG